MEQVPFIFDGLYSKKKSTVPRFLSIGECRVTDGCMAWFGEIGGEKMVPVLRISLSVPNLLLRSLLFSVGFPFFMVSPSHPSQTFVCLLKTSLLIS